MKTKYRIKKITLKTGSQEFYPQVKYWYLPFWLWLDYGGQTCIADIDVGSEHKAKNIIEAHKSKKKRTTIINVN